MSGNIGFHLIMPADLGLKGEEQPLFATQIDAINQNFQIAGNLLGQVIGSGGTVGEDWIAPTLLNSWANYHSTYSSAGYYKQGNTVYLKGVLKNGVSNIMFTLPAGYRPAAKTMFVVSTDGADPRVEVQTDGDVYSYSTPMGWVSLDGLSFRAV